MRVPYLSLFAILGLCVLWGPGFRDTKITALAHRAIGDAGDVGDAVALPDPRLTPGAVLTGDTARICTPGFATMVRHTSRAARLAVYAAYRIAPDSEHYRIEHLIPLALGGADVVANLWPASSDAADDRDRLADFLRRQVCAGKLPLREAQAEIAKDWRAAYRRYFSSE